VETDLGCEARVSILGRGRLFLHLRWSVVWDWSATCERMRCGCGGAEL